MPATPIVQSTRYIDKGVTKCYFLSTIAATNLAPTRAELNAGSDFSRELVDLTGWTVAGVQIETPDLATPFTAKIAGSTQSEDSSLTLYTSKNGTDVRSVVSRGTTGYVCWMDGGDISGNKMETFPVVVTSVGLVRNIPGQEAAKIRIDFAITREPAQSITVPA